MADPKIRVVIAGDAGPLKKALDEAEQETGGWVGRLSGTLGKIGLVTAGLTTAVGGAIGGFVAKTGIDFNSFSEQAQIAFTTMLGSADKAKQFLGDLQSFAAKTPFEIRGLTAASQQLLAFGFHAEDVIPMVTAVGDAVSGLGGSAETMQGVITALGQMKAKGKASAEEMMQLAERGIPAWQYLAKAMGVSVAEAMDKVSKGAVDADTAIKAVVAGMEGQFGGLMDKQSKTWSGMLSTLHDTFEQFAGTVMAPIFERLKTGLGAVLDFVSDPKFMEFGQRLGTALAGGVDTVARVVSGVAIPAFGVLKNAVTTVIEAFQGKGAGGPLGLFAAMLKDTIGLVGQLGSALKGMASDFIGGLTGAQLSGGFFAQLGIGIHDLLGLIRAELPNITRALADFYLGLKGFEGETFFSRLGGAIRSFFGLVQQAIPYIRGEFTSFFLALRGYAEEEEKTFGGQLGTGIRNFAILVADLLRNQVLPALREFGSWFLDTAIPAVQGFAQQAIPLLQPVFGLIRDNLPTIVPLLGVFASTFLALNTAVPAVQGLLGNVTQLFDVLRSAFSIAPAISSIVGLLGGPLTVALLAIAAVVAVAFIAWQQNWFGIQGVVAQVWATIEPILTAVITAITQFGGQILASWQAWATQIAPLAQQAWQNVMTAVQTVLNALMPLITTILSGIASFIAAHGQQIQQILLGAWQMISAAIQTATGVIQGVIQVFLAVLAGNWGAAWDGIKLIVVSIWDGIQGVIGGALKVLEGVLQIALDAISTLWNTTWNGIKTLADTVWEVIKTLISTAIGNVKTGLQTDLDAIKTGWETVWGGIKTAADTIWSAITTLVSTAIGNVKTNIQTELNTVSTAWETAWSTAKTVVGTAWDDIKTAVGQKITELVTRIGQLQSDVQSSLSGIGSWLYQAGVDLIQGMVNGVTAMASSLATAAMQAVNSAVQAAKSALGIHSPSAVFAQLGTQVGAGFVLGLEDMVRDVAMAGEALAMAAVPTVPAPASAPSQPLSLTVHIDTVYATDAKAAENAATDVAYAIAQALRRRGIL